MTENKDTELKEKDDKLAKEIYEMRDENNRIGIQELADKIFEAKFKQCQDEAYKQGKEAGRREVLEKVEDVIEDCVIIKIKDIPKHMVGIDLTWLDKEIAKIKKNLLKELKSEGEE